MHNSVPINCSSSFWSNLRAVFGFSCVHNRLLCCTIESKRSASKTFGPEAVWGKLATIRLIYERYDKANLSESRSSSEEIPELIMKTGSSSSSSSASRKLHRNHNQEIKVMELLLLLLLLYYYYYSCPYVASSKHNVMDFISRTV